MQFYADVGTMGTGKYIYKFPYCFYKMYTSVCLKNSFPVAQRLL